ncbi:MAG TPA: lysine--tRNA ligase [Candidatus Aminicenantes bacterium]|nr:lysine--tRNA ligase [Candidatus Aminicenantes bacterium]
MPEKKAQQRKESLNQAEVPKEGDQEIARQAKMEKLAQEKIELFPHKVKTTHTIFEVTEGFSSSSPEDLEKKKVRVILAGRVMSIRGMGRATFLHIAGSRSRIQAYLKEDKVGKKNYKLFSLIDIGDFVSVEGDVFKTRTGELTVFVDSYTFLAKCLHPLPEKWHGLQNVELRYRKRYLDLIMNPAERDVFRLRSAMISHIRKFFDEKGYIEVETPMMHSIPGGALARPFKTFHNALGLDLYLRIAPELYLKRLIVGGFEKVYEINRNFRNEGISSEHNPEFTMLEFYEAYSDYNDMMKLTEELIHDLSLSLLGTEKIAFMGKKISVKRPWKRIKFKEALVYYSGLAPDRFDDRSGTIELASTLAPDKKAPSYGKALDIIFDKYVKQNLVQPTFVIDFPKEVSPLAKALKENPDEAERFELVMGGMEIANAFSELSDPSEQRKRFEQQAEARKKGDEDAHLVDTDYIHALEYGLPPTGGEGIGIDRLVMIFANRKSIRDVILFPLLRPKKE